MTSNLSGCKNKEFLEKSKHCWSKGKHHFVAEFTIKVVIHPADIAFELWFKGAKYSRNHEPIKIDWDGEGVSSRPAELPLVPSSRSVGSRFGGGHSPSRQFSSTSPKPNYQQASFPKPYSGVAAQELPSAPPPQSQLPQLPDSTESFQQPHYRSPSTQSLPQRPSELPSGMRPTPSMSPPPLYTAVSNGSSVSTYDQRPISSRMDIGNPGPAPQNRPPQSVGNTPSPGNERDMFLAQRQRAQQFASHPPSEASKQPPSMYTQPQWSREAGREYYELHSGN